MSKEEIQDVLDELNTVRPELLKPKTLRLFNAIMSIADDRDLYKHRIDKTLEELKMWNPKNKLIKSEVDYLIELLGEENE